MKAIHNSVEKDVDFSVVVSKSKDTSYLKAIHNIRTNFIIYYYVVSKSKDTSYLKAIHNFVCRTIANIRLFQRAKIQVI